MMIGVSSASLDVRKLDATIRNVAQHFKHWEILTDSEPYLSKVVSSFRDVASSYDLSYSLHAPIFDVNIASINERVRSESVSQIIETMKFAPIIDANMVTLHPGAYPLGVRGFEAKAEEQAIKSIRTIENESADLGIRIALENMANHESMIGRTANQLARLIDGTNVGICFDVGHANTNGEIDGMLELQDSIINVHLHDNNGVIDTHSSLGEGAVDFPKIFNTLAKYPGRYIIEARTIDSARASLEYIKGMRPSDV